MLLKIVICIERVSILNVILHVIKKKLTICIIMYCNTHINQRKNCKGEYYATRYIYFVNVIGLEVSNIKLTYTFFLNS